MKRFWLTTQEAPADGGWHVLLDDRPVHLPGGDCLLLPTRPMARAIAEEWQAAGGALGGSLDWNAVPLTRLAGTAQLRIAPDPAATATALAAYAGADLLCYRAAFPQALARLQAEAWDPLLVWAGQEFGARLLVTQGVVHVSQPAQAMAAIAAAFATQSPWSLAALGVAVPALGSAVLGLALASGRLGAAAAHALATVDERWQAEQWGMDAEAADRRDAIAQDLERAARLMVLAPA